MKRLAMSDSGVGKHSLRHMYGYYCANFLGLDITTTGNMMHHAVESSTKVYFTLSQAKIRQEINRAILDSCDIPEYKNMLVSQDAPKLQFPPHWTNELQQILVGSPLSLKGMK